MNSIPPVTFAIPDLQTGLEFISRISLADPQQAAIDLNRLLDSLLAAPPDGKTYFNLLESARLPVGFVAEELAKRYLNKLLPLGELEAGLPAGGRALAEAGQGLRPLRRERRARGKRGRA